MEKERGGEGDGGEVRKEGGRRWRRRERKEGKEVVEESRKEGMGEGRGRREEEGGVACRIRIRCESLMESVHSQ